MIKERGTMKIHDYLKKIGELLYSNKEYNGRVYFDHKSYDDTNDIPCIIIDDKKVLVEEFYISEDCNIISIFDNECFSYTLDMTNLPKGWNDDVFEEIGLFNLLQDVYYETSMSYEIGDYELDFIGEDC